MKIERQKLLQYAQEIISENYESFSTEKRNQFFKTYLMFMQIAYAAISKFKNFIYIANKQVHVFDTPEMEYNFYYTAASTELKIPEITQLFNLKNELNSIMKFENSPKYNDKPAKDKYLEPYNKKAESAYNNLVYLKKYYSDASYKKDSNKTPQDFSKTIDLVFENIFKNLSEVKKIFTNVNFEKPKPEQIDGKEVYKAPEHDFSKTKYILSIEKLAFQYISNIEILFKKFDAIRINAGEYEKKWENYNLLKAQTYSREIMDNIKKVKFRDDKFQNKKIHDFQKKLIGLKNQLANLVDFKFTQIEKEPDFVFDKDVFVNILYKPSSISNIKNQNSQGYTTAISINKTIKDLQKLETDTIKSELTKLSKSLWDKEKEEYYKNEYVSLIFSKMLNIRQTYKKQLNKIVTSIKNSENIQASFPKIGPDIDLILKFLSFTKIEIRHVIVMLLSDSKFDVDYESVYNQYKAKTDHKILTGLLFWNLFKKLGWTEDEPPDWMYGVEMEPHISSSAEKGKDVDKDSVESLQKSLNKNPDYISTPQVAKIDKGKLVRVQQPEESEKIPPISSAASSKKEITK